MRVCVSPLFAAGVRSASFTSGGGHSTLVLEWDPPEQETTHGCQQQQVTSQLVCRAALSSPV